MALDLRSVILLVGVMSAIMGVVLLFMRRTYPASIRGLAEWGIALLVLFASTPLFAARGLVPDLWSIVVANVLVVGGYSLFYVGTQRFLGVPPTTRLWTIVTLAVAAWLCWTGLVEPHYGRRVMLLAAVMAALSFAHARTILVQGPRGLPAWLAGGALVAQGVNQLARFVAATSDGAVDTMIEASLQQTVFLTVYAIVVLLSGLGVVLLASERLLGQFARLAEAEKRRLTDELLATSDSLTARARRLEQVGALKDQFFTDLAHELRTPLTLVLGPLDDLARHMVACGDEPNRALERVRRNALRLQDLVEQLLDAARLDSGGVRLRARRADLAAFLRRVGERFASAAEKQGLSLDLGAPTTEVWLYFDPDLLDKVMTNLLGNALKFTPAGGTIRVELTPPPDTSDDDAPLDAFARVSVVDTGIGLSPAESARVFERFYQTAAGERRGDGAGIGLSLARGLVELHGGQIGVSSREGVGTTFWFTLPCGASHLTPDEIDLDLGPASFLPSPGPVPTPPAVAGGEDLPADDRPLVLVVEDNADMRGYLAEHLAALGRVAEAADGRSALELASRLKPRLIVSDVMMPVMDGIALAKAVRGDPALRDTRVVLVTAKAGADDRLEGLSVADDHLTKPFRMQELLARAANLVARTAAPPTPQADGAASAPFDRAGLPAAPDAECDRAFAARMRSAVVADLQDPDCGVALLARTMGLSARQLQRRCREVTGQGPLEYIRSVRMDEARALVQRGAYETVAEVAAAVGLSPSYFARLYVTRHGHPPSDDLRG